MVLTTDLIVNIANQRIVVLLTSQTYKSNTYNRYLKSI